MTCRNQEASEAVGLCAAARKVTKSAMFVHDRCDWILCNSFGSRWKRYVPCLAVLLSTDCQFSGDSTHRCGLMFICMAGNWKGHQEWSTCANHCVTGASQTTDVSNVLNRHHSSLNIIYRKLRGRWATNKCDLLFVHLIREWCRAKCWEVVALTRNTVTYNGSNGFAWWNYFSCEQEFNAHRLNPVGLDSGQTQICETCESDVKTQPTKELKGCLL